MYAIPWQYPVCHDTCVHSISQNQADTLAHTHTYSHSHILTHTYSHILTHTHTHGHILTHKSTGTHTHATFARQTVVHLQVSHSPYRMVESSVGSEDAKKLLLPSTITLHEHDVRVEGAVKIQPDLLHSLNLRKESCSNVAAMERAGVPAESARTRNEYATCMHAHAVVTISALLWKEDSFAASTPPLLQLPLSSVEPTTTPHCSCSLGPFHFPPTVFAQKGWLAFG